MQYRHVKRTLPPSLTGFPGEAEIRYFVKVTVQRPGIFRENWRSAIGFRFLPIEPPRSPPTSNEVFARRPYEFQSGLAGFAKKNKLFNSRKPPRLSDTAPRGEVDARLPSPAILTCNEPLPLRIIIRKLNESPEYVFLTSLQVTLIGSTEVRAQDVARTELSTWVMMSLNGLSIPVGNPSDKLRNETVVDKMLWDRIPLPNTVAPSFHTCNLTRRYELEVKVGLGYGMPGDIQVNFPSPPFYTYIRRGLSYIQSPKQSSSPSASKQRSTQESPHPPLSSTPWHPVPPSPPDPQPRTPPDQQQDQAPQDHPSNPPTTPPTRRNSPRPTSPKTTRPPPMKTPWPTRSRPPTVLDGSTAASRMSTRRRWTPRRRNTARGMGIRALAEARVAGVGREEPWCELDREIERDRQDARARARKR